MDIETVLMEMLNNDGAFKRSSYHAFKSHLGVILEMLNKNKSSTKIYKHLYEKQLITFSKSTFDRYIARYKKEMAANPKAQKKNAIAVTEEIKTVPTENIVNEQKPSESIERIPFDIRKHEYDTTKYIMPEVLSNDDICDLLRKRDFSINTFEQIMLTIVLNKKKNIYKGIYDDVIIKDDERLSSYFSRMEKLLDSNIPKYNEPLGLLTCDLLKTGPEMNLHKPVFRKP